MLATMSVRWARPSDAAAIAVVHVASWQQAYRGLMPSELLESLSVPARTERWKQNLASTAVPGAATFVAELDDQVIGFASIGPSRDEDAEGTGELWALYLHPRHWGAGHGHVLHSRAVEALAGAGGTDATLWVLTTNERAQRFYVDHGWAADWASKVALLGGVQLDETRYRLTGLDDAAGVTVLP